MQGPKLDENQLIATFVRKNDHRPMSLALDLPDLECGHSFRTDPSVLKPTQHLSARDRDTLGPLRSAVPLPLRGKVRHAVYDAEKVFGFFHGFRLSASPHGLDQVDQIATLGVVREVPPYATLSRQIALFRL